MLLVQLGINNTRDVWKFCQIGLAPAARPILAKFPNITRVLLIPNCTRQRMITYTNFRYTANCIKLSNDKAKR